MSKILIARETDKGNTSSVILAWFVTSLVGGFAGIPIGAILSAVMQGVLKNNSAPVMYGFFAAPIILGILITFIYLRKDSDTKNHTVCEKCKHQMIPMTEMDTLFSIPATGDDKYNQPFDYLAQNMVRISSMNEILPNKRGCYVCGYTCPNCSNKIIRIADFLPFNGTCHWKEFYYYEYTQFVQARQKNDLL